MDFLYHKWANKNKNLNENTNNNNLFYCNQIPSNYKNDESAIKNVLYRYISPKASNKYLRFIIYYKKF